MTRFVDMSSSIEISVGVGTSDNELKYACVGGPPDDWYMLKVFIDHGEGWEPITNVIEVDANEGYAILSEENGKRRITGKFRIERPKGMEGVMSKEE